MNADVQPTLSITRGHHQPELIKQETLSDLLEQTAQRLPEHTALIYGDQQLSYRALNEKANLMAHHLIQHGVRPGHIVGLWMPRGIDLLVAQAAIAKAGAAWLPFDMDVPTDRIAVCMDDAEAIGIITSTEWSAQLLQLHQPVWTDKSLITSVEGPLSKATDQDPTDPAYVIYTSGSTGKPKGILINQGSICHFLRSENEVLGVKSSDKVYQGFSVAFDMSFEEIWISYLVGATLWIAPKDLVTDPERLCRTLTEQNITVLHAVPTLLALFPQDVPNLRIINLGGEMCPEALVDRWALPHHQMFNTYGPTEATVSASLAQLHAHEPVTIGTPLPNYGLLVMDDQHNLLPQGETGELCIFGPGVVAGYLGRPDLTAEKFIENPWAASEEEKRLYRTGDLARLDEHGQIQCLGRADDQVKIRGFRVELGEIEAALCDQAGVGTAAVVLRQEDGIEQLIAFVVGEDSQTTLDIKTLRTALKNRLPAYMVPNRFEVIPQVPRLLSGKIDRKALRVLPLTSVVDREASDEPQNEAEKILFGILNQLFPGSAIQLDADFFDDLGGHSLLAAVLISHLREHPQYAHLTIQNIYQARRVGAIAQLMLAETANESNSAVAPEIQQKPEADLSRILCGLAQTLILPALISIHILQWLAPFFTYHYLTGGPNDKISVAILASLGVFVASIIISYACSIIGKRLLMAGMKPGRYPLWGLTYFRWWLADRLTDIAPMHLIAGSTLNNLYLKALGAKIGHDVTIGSVHIRMPSLLTIADGVSIGSHVNLENAKVENGHLILGTINLQKESYIGSYAVVEENTTLEPYAHLNALSALRAHGHISENEIWDGAPARKVGLFDKTNQPARPALSKGRQYAEYIYYTLSTLLIACIFFIPIFPSFIIVDWLDTHLLDNLTNPNNRIQTALHYFVLAIPASAMMILVTALISAGIRKVAVPHLQEGMYPVHGAVYYRKWFATQILETSLQVLRGLFATVYAPNWLRLMGAKVGKDAEISTATGVVPELLSLGDESFIADAVMLGDEEIRGGWMTLSSTSVGHRSFVGNSAYIADGTHLPDGVLIGVQSKAPESTELKQGETWFGSPALRLPARESITCFAEQLTFKPGPARRLMRGLIEGLRIVLPLALAIGVGYMIVLDIIDITVAKGWLMGFVALSLAGLLYGLGCFLIVTIMKWLLIGRYKPHSAPMWTMFVWLSEGITSLYETVAVPNFLNYLRGTPMLPTFLRLLGTKIGRQVYLDTTDITEFDCVSIGDRSELNSFSGPQTHLFEDRVMKIGHVHIGNDTTIHSRSIVLYSAEVGDRSILGPLTLVMKGEKIPPHSAWIGSPAVPWRQ